MRPVRDLVRPAVVVAAAAVASATAAGCDAPDPPCASAWHTELDQPVGVLLAAWGRADDDAWLVGGGLGAGTALLLRWNGVTLAPVPLARPETLWWAWGPADAGDVWIVGEDGLVLRGGDAGFAPVDGGTHATLYGVWGSGADDVWIVGGRPDGQAQPDDDLLLRWDGQTLTRVPLPTARGTALFKVWGASADDVWLVGEAGTVWRFHDGVFVDHSAEITSAASLLTVHGCSADEVYAVGGAHVWRWDGATWGEITGLPGFAGASGVACGEREVLVVGLQGLKLRLDRAGGTWLDEQFAEPWDVDFHGAWAAPGGALWAVGGDFLAPPSGGARRGLVARRACR